MKKITVLFIQGGGEGAWEVDHKLVENLQEALGATGEVVYPKCQTFVHLSLYEKQFP